MRQTCILILGMHRSGTSALSGALNLLDVYFGSDLIKPDANNPKGYFESQSIFRRNEGLLKQFNSSWDDIFFGEKTLPKGLKSRELEELLKQNYLEKSDVFAIKDPRLVFLFPVYAQALENLGVEVKLIIPNRDPLEVARSLQKRNGFSIGRSFLLWTHHLLSAEKISRKFPRVFTQFDELISDPEKVILTISKGLNLDFSSIYNEKRNLVFEFLDPHLISRSISKEGSSPEIPEIVSDLFSLTQRANDENLVVEFDQLYREFFEFKSLFFNHEITNVYKHHSETRNNLSTRNNELEQLKQDLAARKNELDQLKQDLAARHSELEQLRQDLAARSRELGQLKRDMVTRNNQLEQLNFDLKIKTNELEGIQKELLTIHTSKFWKYTRALRKRVFRKP